MSWPHFGPDVANFLDLMGMVSIRRHLDPVYCPSFTYWKIIHYILLYFPPDSLWDLDFFVLVICFLEEKRIDSDRQRLIDSVGKSTLAIWETVHVGYSANGSYLYFLCTQ